ncbi:MAG: FKBP-type peptidyl-prolyl cis-trans isomerase [Candidatus Nomurabacteria bacterium]
MKSTNIGIIIAVLVLVGGVVFTQMIKQNKPEVAEKSVEVKEEQPINTNEATTTNATTTTATSTPMAPLKDLQLKDEVVGKGAEAKKGDSVTVQYVGALTNGKIFDASKNHGDAGFTFTIGGGQVIKGWDMGVAGMKVGGKRILAIPAALGYGPQEMGNGAIPANSDLLFEVELVKIGK